ncbi:SRPBCC family protein [Cohnella hongkongensis]|uniref:SRPBCC domain-containing protein n=1 Tax=Cohnella hongkongensis TaxID=178337 RepID=A0ABV9F9P9_9BACL
MSLSLSLDFQFTTTIEKLWSALTDSSKLAQWIAENDFKPVVGHRFQFRHPPSEWWDGIVDCEVLVVEAPTRLSFTMATGEEKHTVVLTVQALGDGKVGLHLDQTGFSNAYGVAGAKQGWSAWFDKLDHLLQA